MKFTEYKLIVTTEESMPEIEIKEWLIDIVADSGEMHQINSVRIKQVTEDRGVVISGGYVEDEA